MASRKEKKGAPQTPANRVLTYNCTVCTLAAGVPAGVNVRVRATSIRAARARAHEIMDHLLEGVTVLGPSDSDLTDGESVRLYLDRTLMRGEWTIYVE